VSEVRKFGPAHHFDTKLGHIVYSYIPRPANVDLPSEPNFRGAHRIPI
jgi:hypothetical protein